MPDWDDVRLFLAIMRTKRLVGASKITGIDHTTVARRLTAFETAIGARLFDRSPRGMALTEAGTVFVPHAERIEAEMEAAAAKLGERDHALSGPVRIATPEAFGTLIVAPNIGDFHRRHPDIRIELSPEPNVVSLANHEADIAIVLNRPPRGRIFARRLIDFRLGLYCSADYLAERGPIANRADLAAHPFAWYIEERVETAELFDLGDLMADVRPSFRSTSSAAQYAAVAGGFGVGLLHCFAADGDPALVRILPDLVLTRCYWLVLHADHQHLPRVRAAVTFLDEILERARGRF